jgi:hypothetical protein
VWTLRWRPARARLPEDGRTDMNTSSKGEKLLDLQFNL